MGDTCFKEKKTVRAKKTFLPSYNYTLSSAEAHREENTLLGTAFRFVIEVVVSVVTLLRACSDLTGRGREAIDGAVRYPAPVHRTLAAVGRGDRPGRGRGRGASAAAGAAQKLILLVSVWVFGRGALRRCVIGALESSNCLLHHGRHVGRRLVECHLLGAWTPCPSTTDQRGVPLPDASGFGGHPHPQR